MIAISFIAGLAAAGLTLAVLVVKFSNEDAAPDLSPLALDGTGAVTWSDDKVFDLPGAMLNRSLQLSRGLIPEKQGSSSRITQVGSGNE